jgi:uncharacterized protein YndB with AHSA1/START domain
MTDLPVDLGGAPGFRRFSYEVSFFLAAPPTKVWIALVHEIDRWWTYRLRDRTRCVIEAQVGGRWMQEWDNGGALFGTFTVFDPPSLLCVTGPMAMTRPAHNWLQFSLAPVEGGTTLTLVHDAVGDFDADTGDIYESGWQELIGTALRAWLARG